MKRKATAVAACLLALAVLVAGCGAGGGASDDVVRVVVAGPMTGNSAQFGESMKQGVEMAVAELNAAGGILGKQVEVSYEDDKGDPREAANVAQRIATDSSVVAVIGHFLSSATLAASPIYQQAGIPEIAVASTDPAATSAGDYIFRVNVTNTHQGAGIVDWLVNEQGKKRLAVIYVNDDYGKGIADIARDTAEALGAEIVYEGTVAPSGEQDFTVLLTQAKAAEPDALVIFTFYAVGAQIVLQADQVGLDVLIAASDAVYAPDFIDIAGEKAEGVYVATWFHPDDDAEETQRFVEAYEAAYKRGTDSWAPYAYDAMMILADAIERAGTTDRAAVRDALAETEGFVGATGVTTFTEERVPDASAKRLLFTVVRDGAFELIK